MTLLHLVAIAALGLVGCYSAASPGADDGNADSDAAEAGIDVAHGLDVVLFIDGAVGCQTAVAGDPCMNPGDRCNRLYEMCGAGGASSLTCGCSAEHVWWCYEFEPCGWSSDGGPDAQRPPSAVITADRGALTGMAGVVNCGGVACETAGHECCPASGGSGFECVARGEGVTAGCGVCDGPEDCASGESCCAGTVATCGVTGDCQVAWPFDVIVCDVDADCPAGEHCCAAAGGDGATLRRCQQTACAP